MKRQFSVKQFVVPKHDCDIILVFPGKKDKVVIQLRPSNADIGYNGSLDIVLPRNQAVTNWIGDDMQSAPKLKGCREHERMAKQLVTDLPGDYS